MTTIQTFIKKYPVLTYYVLTFAISWGGVLLVIGGPGRIPGTAEENTKLFPVVYLATVAGPALASVLLTGLIGGREGFRELRSQLLNWRVDARWYAAALLTAPLSVMGTLLALSLLSPEFLPGIFVTSDRVTPPGILTMGFGFVVGIAATTGFLEELGWTGFAIPRLRLRYGIFMNGLLMGLLWGAWHFVSNVWASGKASEELPLALYLPAILFSFLPPYRALMVWVYDRTGSVIVAMLMHASLVMFWLISTPPGITGVSLVTWYLAWGAVLWIVVGAVAVANRRQLSRKLLQRRAA